MGLRWLVIAVVAVGCRSTPDHAISSWTLEQDAGSTAVVVPAHFDVPERASTYTLRAEVEIPPELRDRTPSLVIPYFAAHVTLRVDGIEATATEIDAVEGYHGRGPHSWQFPDEVRGRARVTLTMKVDHRWLQSGWLDSVPRLVAHGERDAELRTVKLFNDDGAAFGLFGMGVIGVLYLAIFLVDRRRRAYLWFAIQGLSALSYPFFVLGFAQGVFGTFDVAFVATLLPTAAVAAVYFTHEVLELGAPSRVWRALWVACAAVSIIAAGPFTATYYGGRMAVLAITTVMVYQLWILSRLAFRKQRPIGARHLFVAWACLGVLASCDMLAWVGVVDVFHGVRGGCAGLGVFAIVQAMLIGRQHIASLRTSDDLNAALTARVAQLEGRQREIEVLNQELRRQIADRSEDLYDALRSLATTAGSSPTLEEGQVVDDRYRVVRALGSGGMGAVYEAIRLADGRRFAIKVTQQRDAVALARLAREAQIAAQVVHPNIVAIVDVGVASAGFLFMVIELVSGKAMNERVERYRDIPWVLHVLAQVAGGLASLHRHGIVHRDLKPANILIEDGEVPLVKLADFGISRLATEEPDHKRLPTAQPTSLLRATPASSRGPPMPAKTSSTFRRRRSPAPPVAPSPSADRTTTPTDKNSSLTQTGFIAGTPTYMAPELTTGDGIITSSADIFSFGVVAFQAVTGRLPWSEPAALACAAGRTVPPPASLGLASPELPAPIAELVIRCLSLTPGHRPTADELAESLRALA